MAIVRTMSRLSLDKDMPHTEVDCTYSIVGGGDKEKFLQIDTYGSQERQIRNKKSQSIRFSSEALRRLAAIIKAEFT